MTITISKTRLAIAILAIALIAPATALATHVFDDVEHERFYADAAEWAAENEITTGVSTNPPLFAPDDPVTRGQNVTFLKRYDDNIVQPALEDLQTGLDDAETARNDNRADIDTNAADIDALEAADNITHGPIVISQGTNTLMPNTTSGASAVDNFISGTRVSGDGLAVTHLTGPISVSGESYVLESVEYCINLLTGGAFLDDVTIYGGFPTSNSVAIDEDNRTAAGCYSFDVGDSSAQGYGILFDVDGGGTLRVEGLQTTWSPAPAGASPGDGAPIQGGPSGENG